MIVEVLGKRVKVTDEQIEAYKGLTKLQQRFCLAYLAENDHAAAYRKAKNYQKKGKEKTVIDQRVALTCGKQILKKNEVLAFLSLFNEKNAEQIATTIGESIITREELLGILADRARSSYSRIGVVTKGGLEMKDSLTESETRCIKEIIPTANGAIFKIASPVEAAKILLDEMNRAPLGSGETSPIERVTADSVRLAREKLLAGI